MKPFLKWAGGKYKLVEEFKQHFPKGKRFIEPFLGSGAVSLNVDYPEYIANDFNPTLVALWQCVRSPEFIDYAETFFTAKNNVEATYYRHRERFNNNLQVYPNTWETAALFLYLNKHGYNGLCRFNSKGEFNVPFGHKTKAPSFPRKEMEAASVLANKMKITCGDFRKVFEDVKKGDVIYTDPPYVPLSDTAYFTSYSTEGFTIKDQQDLVQCVLDATKQGATVIVSNHDTLLTRDLYKNATELHSIKVQRSISCKGKSRAKVPELIAIFRP